MISKYRRHPNIGDLSSNIMFILFEAVIVLIVTNMSHCDSNFQSSEAVLKEFAKRDGRYNNNENNQNHLYNRGKLSKIAG